MSVSVRDMNVLVGPNNSGKSTVLSAFRALEGALRRARVRNPERLTSVSNTPMGYVIPPSFLPIALENIHSDLLDTHSKVHFKLSNGNSLTMEFPSDGGCFLVPATAGREIRTATDFRAAFPVRIAAIPPLGPVESAEEVLRRDTVQSALTTHRAARHFRNYWYHFPDGFDGFADRLAETWPGMTIQRPELSLQKSPATLQMFCTESRSTREIYWSGVGFQVWCQILTHLSSADDATMLLVDEPEVYLHPDVQRQLLAILRRSGQSVVMATHSSEIMEEADPDEIVVVDKSKRIAKRVRDVEGVQRAMDAVGSIHNVSLARLARNGRLLFTEDESDYRRIRRFAGIVGSTSVESGMSVSQADSGGFASWTRIRDFAWGLGSAVGAPLRVGAIFDRDFFPPELIYHVESQLRGVMAFVWVLRRKEIENYLIMQAPLQRALERAIRDRSRQSPSDTIASIPDIRALLDEISVPMKTDLMSQYVARRWEWMQRSSGGQDQATCARTTLEWFESKWAVLETRLEVVSGKSVLREFRARVQAQCRVSISDAQIFQAFRRVDVPEEIIDLVNALDEFRRAAPVAQEA